MRNILEVFRGCVRTALVKRIPVTRGSLALVSVADPPKGAIPPPPVPDPDKDYLLCTSWHI